MQCINKTVDGTDAEINVVEEHGGVVWGKTVDADGTEQAWKFDGEDITWVGEPDYYVRVKTEEALNDMDLGLEEKTVDKFAGAVDMVLNSELVESLGDVSEGDRVAMNAGDGLQGIVTEVRTEGSVVGDKMRGEWGVKKIKVRTHTGGERQHLVARDPEEMPDNTIRFKLPGGSNDRVHTLVRFE